MCSLFFFNDTATTEIYTLSLHDALPIYYDVLVPLIPGESRQRSDGLVFQTLHAIYSKRCLPFIERRIVEGKKQRSEEHTSELQSRQYLVCRLLLEKKTSMCMCPVSSASC